MKVCFVLLHWEGHVFQSYACAGTDQGHPCISFASTRPICTLFTYPYWSFSIFPSWLLALQANIYPRNRTRKCECHAPPRYLSIELECPQRLDDNQPGGKGWQRGTKTLYTLSQKQKPLHLLKCAHDYSLTFERAENCISERRSLEGVQKFLFSPLQNF